MINTNLDWSAIQKEYAENGNVIIKDILNPDIANTVSDSISSIDDWVLYCSGRKETVTMPEHEFLALPPKEKAEISRALMFTAQTDYAFHFYQHNLGDTTNKVLAEFYKNLGSEQFMGFLKYVTGEFRIVTYTGMASQYRQASFLRTHSDHGETIERLFAYVFGFTRDWDANWGGMLNFVDSAGNPIKVVTPGFNSLTLFKVPADHFVSQVANYATKYRNSITGWCLKS